MEDLERWSRVGELRYELLLPRETPSNNLIKGLHFHAYKALRGEWQMLVRAALGRQARGAALARSFLEVTRRCAGGGLDWDNAYGGLKPVLDCLVAPTARNPDGLGLIEDDSPRAMPYPPFVRQLPAKRGAASTLVRIYELDA